MDSADAAGTTVERAGWFVHAARTRRCKAQPNAADSFACICDRFDLLLVFAAHGIDRDHYRLSRNEEREQQPEPVRRQDDGFDRNDRRWIAVAGGTRVLDLCDLLQWCCRSAQSCKRDAVIADFLQLH